jgi:hypothetical protein
MIQRWQGGVGPRQGAKALGKGNLTGGIQLVLIPKEQHLMLHQGPANPIDRPLIQGMTQFQVDDFGSNTASHGLDLQLNCGHKAN